MMLSETDLDEVEKFREYLGYRAVLSAEEFQEKWRDYETPIPVDTKKEPQ